MAEPLDMRFGGRFVWVQWTIYYVRYNECLLANMIEKQTAMWAVTVITVRTRLVPHDQVLD